jgi:hypothetical protein
VKEKIGTKNVHDSWFHLYEDQERKTKLISEDRFRRGVSSVEGYEGAV